jgi:hypothetical protein
MHARNRFLPFSVPAVLLAALAVLPTTARAQGEEREPLGVESTRGLEIEPHFTFGAENVYGASGLGAGLRVGVPLLDGHVGRLPDDLALSLGGDIVHYDNCYWGGYCSANYLMVPVAAQWNLDLSRRVSFLAEGGVFVYKGWFDACRPGDVGCAAPSDFGVLPTIAVGGRIRFSDTAAFTMRVGYPTVTLGVSFL